MKIGIDARNLVPSLSGIGRYVLEMVKALGAQGHQLVLYFPEKPHQSLPELPFCELRISNFKGPWRRLAWSRTTLPEAANADDLDFFWGPAHRLPVGLRADLPRIVTIHDLVWRKAALTMRWQTWLGERFFMASALQSADAIVADSIATAKDIAEFRPSVKERIKVIYPGLTRLPQLEPATSKAPSKPERNYALFVGTLEPRKNLIRILDAIKIIERSLPESFNLKIVGGQGWRSGHLENLIRSNGLYERVKMTGHVSDAELSQLYQGADFLLMPSLYEGFGFPIIEAQSFGIPVITSNRSSMPEVAGRGAIFVDPESTSQIAEAIINLATKQSLRAELSKTSRDNVARFSWSSAAEQLTGVFSQTQT